MPWTYSKWKFSVLFTICLSDIPICLKAYNHRWLTYILHKRNFYLRLHTFDLSTLKLLRTDVLNYSPTFDSYIKKIIFYTNKSNVAQSIWSLEQITARSNSPNVDRRKRFGDTRLMLSITHECSLHLLLKYRATYALIKIYDYMHLICLKFDITIFIMFEFVCVQMKTIIFK